MADSAFLSEAEARGFVFQCTDAAGLDAALRDGRVSGYTGFDLTADCLHVGSMVQIMLLRLLQKHGHRPVLLLGGGTTKIGDPSGKEEARQLLTPERIAANGEGILAILRRFVGTEDDRALIADNAEWLDRLGYIELLRDVGPHFPLGRMLSLDSVRTRLEREQGLSFLEFNYQVLQSYDFRELNRRHGVTLQFGGSDQWGNIVSGAELVRRTEGKQVFGLTTPLISTASGAKMGKTASGAVWLSAERTAPFDYWQFWRNTEDGDVGRFLKLFTEVPVSECDRLGALGGAEINEGKKVLATEATALCHGREEAERCAETARLSFEEGRRATDALPVRPLAADALAAGLSAFRLFVEAGLCASNGEAR
ncbi:MAG: tyrosine--tRNA ligase, partial [Gluconacetobacter diazotrophicus]|nr:tyrosine--tRNA ligase [Gluconacetobacter diazotrophicus]